MMAGKSQMTVADLIVAHLEEIGVKYVFGVPGGAIEPLYNALARSERRGGLQAITARHESGAAFMADGYARESGKLGVCVATSGPGTTNLITGVACANENGIPVLALTGQPPLPLSGRRPFQESGSTGVNTVGMFRHCTRYGSLLSHPDQAETKILSAIGNAIQHQGAAHLAIPADIQRSPAPAGWRRPSPGLLHMLRRAALLDEASVQELFEELRAARQPVFLLGSGCGHAVKPLLELIERHSAAFITTPDGKGFADPCHPLYQGVFGFAGHHEARELLASKPDLIIAAGVNIGEWNSANWSGALLNERLVHLASTGEQMARSNMAHLHVQGGLAAIVERLLELDRSRGAPRLARKPPRPRPIEEIPPPVSSGVRPQVLMEELSRRCPPDTRFVADTGNSLAWAIHHLELGRPGRRAAFRNAGARDTAPPAPGWLRVLVEFAPMGWAIGSAAGIAAARPDSLTVCLTGDGAWLMNGQEITVAKQHRLTVLFVILNDGALGMVKHGQRANGAESIGTELPPVDFAALARAMGVWGQAIRSEAELEAFDFGALLSGKGPALLDVRIDGEQKPPIGLRLETVKGIL